MKKLVRIIFFTIILCVLLFLPVVSATNTWICDKEGRALILHGINISNIAKRTPDHMSWQTFDDYERLVKDWGFNVIRFLIFWSAIEPKPNVYNETYLDKVEERLDWAESLGIYVILDMHQDVYGEKFGGDGAPLWATWDCNMPFFPLKRWWLNYIQPAVRCAFTNFWIKDELQEYFISAWAHVANRFKDHSAIIGYDLFNEPFFGNIFPRIFERIFLKNFYSKLIYEMKKIDPDGLFFYEPQITTSTGIRSYLGVLPEANLTYAPHFYHSAVHEGYPYFGFPFIIKKGLSHRNIEAEAAEVPWILGEFGVINNTFGMDKYLIHLLSLLNDYIAGWTYWAYDYESHNEFGFLEDNGNEKNQLNYLVYPYPQKIAGDPTKFSYSFKDRSCYVEFEENKSVNGSTEIFVGLKRIYPEGFNVACSDPEDTWSWEYVPEYDIIKVWTNPETENHWILINPSRKC